MVDFHRKKELNLPQRKEPRTAFHREDDLPQKKPGGPP